MPEFKVIGISVLRWFLMIMTITEIATFLFSTIATIIDEGFGALTGSQWVYAIVLVVVKFLLLYSAYMAQLIPNIIAAALLSCSIGAAWATQVTEIGGLVIGLNIFYWIYAAIIYFFAAEPIKIKVCNWEI